MDVEMKKTMDEIMEKMHKITTYIIEYEKAELSGKTITKEQIINDKMLNKIFVQIQELYRKLQDLIKKQNAKLQSYNKDLYDSGNILQDKDELEQGVNSIILENLKAYLDNSYIDLRYIPLYEIYYNENEEVMEEIESSIYKNTGTENIRLAEYQAQRVNLENIYTRDDFPSEIGKLPFKNKRDILNYIAEGKTYEYMIQKMNEYMSDLNKKSSQMNQENYELMKRTLLEQKYSIYLGILNNKYNGIIQENDFGQFAVIKKFIEEKAETVLLDMEQFEIDENINRDLEIYKNKFMEIINKAIEESSEKYNKNSKRKGKKIKQQAEKINDNIVETKKSEDER